MNYWNWILPFFIFILLSGYYLGKKLQHLQNRIRFKKSWIILSLLFALSIFMRSIIAVFIFYVLLFHLCFDGIKWIFSLFKKEKINLFFKKIYCRGLPILLLSFVFILYGIYNISHPILKEYDIKIKSSEKIDLEIGMISDLHLGNVSAEKTLNQLIETANQFNFDLFLLVGDIFDEHTKESEKEMAYQKLSSIKTKFGIYYIEGNHDLLTENVIENYQKNKIQVLDDKTVVIDGKINLIGRKDYRNQKENKPRKSLEELIKEIKKELPIILLDHQPRDENQEQLGVDLQISGHTHNGQLFPLNLFLAYGYQKKGNYQRIVSSGYSGWAIPIRTSGKSEILKIKLSNE